MLVKRTFVYPATQRTHDMLLLEFEIAFDEFDRDEARYSGILSGALEPNEDEKLKRGRPTYAALDKLLTVVVQIWQRELPAEGRGITGTNSAKGGKRHHGPLLDFVAQLLQIEGVGWTHREGAADFTSRKSLAERLLGITRDL